MVNAPQTSLKVIIVVHLVLTVWASMAAAFLPTAYIYMSAFTLFFGVLAIASPESVDAVLMFFILNTVSILMDIIFLGLKAPPAITLYNTTGNVHEFRFCLGMAIVNLLVRPVTSFLLYRIYQERGGSYSDLGIPNFGGARGGNYENIDQPVPTNNVETAAPHQRVDSPALTP